MSRFCIVPTRVLSDARMTSMSHLRVLMALGQHTDKAGWCSPSHRRIGELAGGDKPLSKSRVSHIMAELVKWGYIERSTRERQDGGQTSNLYRVLFDIGEPETSPFEGADPVAPDAPPVAEYATPVARHGTQPPVARHGAQPHKNAPREGEKNPSVDETPSAEPVGPAGSKPNVSQQLVDLFHEHCPSLPRVKLLSDKRRQAIRNRWMQAGRDLGRYAPSDVAAGLDWWAKYFRTVERSNFLTGRSGSFAAGFDWLLKQENFVKVVEGNYANKEAQQ